MVQLCSDRLQEGPQWYSCAQAGCRKLDTRVFQPVTGRSSIWKGRKKTHQIDRQTKHSSVVVKMLFQKSQIPCNDTPLVKISVSCTEHVMKSVLTNFLTDESV